jgi:hypothetical protein
MAMMALPADALAIRARMAMCTCMASAGLGFRLAFPMRAPPYLASKGGGRWEVGRGRWEVGGGRWEDVTEGRCLGPVCGP